MRGTVLSLKLKTEISVQVSWGITFNKNPKKNNISLYDSINVIYMNSPTCIIDEDV